MGVAPQGEGVACRVKLRLMVEAPGVVLRPQQQLTEQAQRRPPDWVAYTDGSEDLGKAGWAYAVLIGGDAIGDEGASLTSEGYAKEDRCGLTGQKRLDNLALAADAVLLAL